MRIDDLDADGYSWSDAYSSGPPPPECGDDVITGMPIGDYLHRRRQLIDQGYLVVHITAREQRRRWLDGYDALDHEP
jgi:hypothetical protein